MALLYYLNQLGRLNILILYCYTIAYYWTVVSSTDLCIIVLGVVNLYYFKFLSIWRFFQTCALIDGVRVDDNIEQCINNRYTFLRFWRSWNASFNMWIGRLVIDLVHTLLILSAIWWFIFQSDSKRLLYFLLYDFFLLVLGLDSLCGALWTVFSLTQNIS
jgi:hypothetical protein